LPAQAANSVIAARGAVRPSRRENREISRKTAAVTSRGSSFFDVGRSQSFSGFTLALAADIIHPMRIYTDLPAAGRSPWAAGSRHGGKQQSSNRPPAVFRRVPEKAREG
jgi:hypothetical protein